MSKIRFNPSGAARAALLVAPVLLALAAPATAQQLTSKGPAPSDPVVLDGESSAAPQRFFINNAQDRELVRSATPRKVEVCDRNMDGDAYGLHRGSEPIKLTVDGRTTTVDQGSCAAVVARTVEIAPDGMLAGNRVLVGNVRQVEVPASSAAAASK